jgi:hypothetical protein
MRNAKRTCRFDASSIHVLIFVVFEAQLAGRRDLASEILCNGVLGSLSVCGSTATKGGQEIHGGHDAA